MSLLDGQCTGQAYILSNKQNGENSIIIVGAANQAYKEFSASWAPVIEAADVLLL